MKPYKFKPYLKETIWGGEKIAALKGVETNSTSIGESWEISCVPGHESVTAERGLPEDDDLGITLPQLIDRYKGELVGNAVYEKHGNRFPLLVKFIDSRQDLSVQVHPNDELALTRHGCSGKTEMWYIMDADPGAKIYTGLNRQITPEDYEHLVGSGRFMDVVSSYMSHKGDLYFLPSGRVHSIGAGNLLAEIQQTSDITYRIYDFDRRDAQGNPRELHVELAKDAIDYKVYPEYRSSYDSTSPQSNLIQCPYFNVHRVVVRDSVEIDYHVDSFVIVICLCGEANVNGVKIQQGETILVPASDNILRIIGNATFLTASLPASLSRE